jgi:hypothetical protein
MALDLKALNDIPADEIPAVILHLSARWNAERGQTPAPAEPRSQNSAEPEERMLTVREAAAMLRVSEKWVRRHQDELPFARRFGGLLRFSLNGLRKWQARQRA